MLESRSVWVALALGVVIPHIAGCSRDNAPTAQEPPPNVLLVVVDTLRVDKLGCYDGDLGLTPHIDTFAAQSVRFEQAYAHASWTLPSFASLFTSLPPPGHGAGGKLGQFRELADSLRTVAECFRDAGYATASVVNVDYLTDAFGMTQGFDQVDFEFYSSNTKARSATKTTAAALEWLRKRPARPFFLFVHYFDPHLVYAPPPIFRKKFAAPEDQDSSEWVFGSRPQIVACRWKQAPIRPSTIRRAEKLYNGEVAYTDYEVGRLIEAIDQMGLESSTIVVFTADHGEEFLDHGSFEHGHTLYNELVHVPLLIRYPKRLKAGAVSTTAGLVDVTPTLCALADVEPDPAFRGHNLVELIGATEPQTRPIMFAGNFWGPAYQGWLSEGYKLIVDSDEVKLFNLHNDPGEKTDLSKIETERLERMTEDMQLAFEAATAEAPEQPNPVQLSPDELHRLRSLGYLP